MDGTMDGAGVVRFPRAREEPRREKTHLRPPIIVADYRRRTGRPSVTRRARSRCFNHPYDKGREGGVRSTEQSSQLDE